LAKWLNSLGVPAEQRHAGGKTIRRSTGLWFASRIAPMLRSTTYVGRHVVTTSSGPVERAVPRLVDDATFAEAQRVLSSNRTTAKRNCRREYLLRGLLVCADPACGCRCAGMSIKRTTRQGPKEYTTYICGAAVGRRRYVGKDCHARYLNGGEAEEFVWARCAAYLRDPGRYLGLAQDRLRAMMADTSGAEVARKRLYAAKQEKEAERERVMMLFTRGHRTYDETERELARVKDEAAAVQRELDALRDKDQLAAAYEAQFTRASVLLAALGERVDDIEATDDRAAKRKPVETLLVRAEVLPTVSTAERLRPVFVFGEDPCQHVSFASATARRPGTTTCDCRARPTPS
jgi:site-specific DNA recombinase